MLLFEIWKLNHVQYICKPEKEDWMKKGQYVVELKKFTCTFCKLHLLKNVNTTVGKNVMSCTVYMKLKNLQVFEIGKADEKYVKKIVNLLFVFFCEHQSNGKIMKNCLKFLNTEKLEKIMKFFLKNYKFLWR